MKLLGESTTEGTLDAEVVPPNAVPEAKKEKKGLKYYLGPYATKNWWRSLLKYILVVGAKTLLEAMVDSFAGTVKWYLKKNDPVAEATAAAAAAPRAGDNTASRVFSPERTVSRDYGVRPASSYSPPGFSDEPFQGFGSR